MGGAVVVAVAPSGMTGNGNTRWQLAPIGYLASPGEVTWAQSSDLTSIFKRGGLGGRANPSFAYIRGSGFSKLAQRASLGNCVKNSQNRPVT